MAEVFIHYYDIPGCLFYPLGIHAYSAVRSGSLYDASGVCQLASLIMGLCPTILNRMMNMPFISTKQTD